MSREVKFRAWDKRHHKMFKVESLHQDQADYVDDGKTEFSAYEPRYGYMSRGEVELMQYIGLKDKNREIFHTLEVVGNIYENHELLESK